MSWDDPTKMPLYHVQIETKRRTVSYEIATTEFDAIPLAKAHYKQRNDLFVEQIHIGGYSNIGYVDKKPFPVFYEAKVVSGLPFEENEEMKNPCNEICIGPASEAVNIVAFDKGYNDGIEDYEDSLEENSLRRTKNESW